MKGDTPIKAARKKLGKTQVQVAKEVGVAETAYQQYEYGNVTQQRKIPPHEWNEYFIKVSSAEKRRSMFVKHLPQVGFKIPDKLGQFMIFMKRDVLAKFSNMQYVLINLLETPLIALLLTYIIKYRNISRDSGGEYIFLNNSNLPVYIFMSVINDT